MSDCCRWFFRKCDPGGALLSGLRSGALEQAVAKMEADEADEAATAAEPEPEP